MLVLFSILLLSSIQNASSAGIRCSQLLNSDAFYTLDPLSSITDYTYNESNFRIYYNFCTLTLKKCNNESAYALLYYLDANKSEINENCLKLTSSSIIKDFEYFLLDSNDVSAGIQLKLTNGQQYLAYQNSSEINTNKTAEQNETNRNISNTNQSNSNTSYETIFKISCSKKEQALPFELDDVYIHENQVYLTGSSSSGCPVLQFSTLYSFADDHKNIFALLAIVFGFIECFFGLAVLKPSIFFIGYLSGFGFLMLIFNEFILKPDSSVLILWILLLFSVMVGTMVGYVATALPKIGFMGLGLWLGFVLAFTLNNLFLYKIEFNPPELGLYILMGIFGASFMIFSVWIWKELCIIATSFLGAYLVIRSSSLFIGKYPNELTLAKQIKYKELQGVGWEFYVYFAFLMLLTFAGIFVQLRNKKKFGGKYAGDYDDISIESPVQPTQDYVEMKVLEKEESHTNSKRSSKKSLKEEKGTVDEKQNHDQEYNPPNNNMGRELEVIVDRSSGKKDSLQKEKELFNERKSSSDEGSDNEMKSKKKEKDDEKHPKKNQEKKEESID